jgi:putative hemolysin
MAHAPALSAQLLKATANRLMLALTICRSDPVLIHTRLDEPPSYNFTSFLIGDNFIYILISVILIFLAGVISASEASLFSLDGDQAKNLLKKRAGLLNNPRLLLSVLTTWKYAMLVGCSVIFTLAVQFSRDTDFFSETLVLTIGFAFFGIIIPKVYGAFHKRIAALLAGVFSFLVRITGPVINPLLKMSYKVEKKLEALAEETSVKELTQALELAAADKNTTADEKEILKGIVNFGILTVDDVMRPVNEINSVDVNLNYHDLLLYIKKSGFSRLPAYRDSFDNIEGVLYIKDLLPYLNEAKKFTWQKFLRPAFFAPQTRKIDLLLKEFQEKRVHMALALDESNKVSGIITLEDIIEEIIGDIHDEFDEAGSYYSKIDDKTFIFDSKISVHEFCRILDLEPANFGEGDYEGETLGAVLLEMQNDLPRIGDQIVLDSVTLVIEAIDHKRIKKIRVHIHEQKEN